MRSRIEQELALLRQMHGGVDHAEDAGEDWFRLPRYTAPAGWRIGGSAVQELPMVFLIKADYPGAPPYGFFAPGGLTYGDAGPNNTGDPPKPVPYPGEWIHFSWSVDNWAATADVSKGSNLVAWCRSFAVRLREGA